MVVTMVSKMQQISMYHDGERGHKGYDYPEIGTYYLKVKKIQKKAQLKALNQGYGEVPIQQNLGREPTNITVICSLVGISNGVKLQEFVNTLKIHTKYVHNVFLPGQLLSVSNNAGVIMDMDINSAWRVDKAVIEQSNIDGYTMTLNLIRDENAEKEFV